MLDSLIETKGVCIRVNGDQVVIYQGEDAIILSHSQIPHFIECLRVAVLAVPAMTRHPRGVTEVANANLG